MALRVIVTGGSNREVIIKDTISLKYNLKAGVPQGSILCTLLSFFLLMTLPIMCLDCVDCLLMAYPLAKDHLDLLICVLLLPLILNNDTH